MEKCPIVKLDDEKLLQSIANTADFRPNEINALRMLTGAAAYGTAQGALLHCAAPKKVLARAKRLHSHPVALGVQKASKGQGIGAACASVFWDRARKRARKRQNAK
jgi:hypothetical protein